MPPMRKSALEGVWLDRDRSCGHEPRSVGELILQQPLDTSLVDHICCGKLPGNMQSVKCFACGISFTWNAGKLAPASVAVLFRFQGPDERCAFRHTGARIAQCV